MARSSRALGVRSVSPVGLTLTSGCAGARTSAPTRMMPRSSMSLESVPADSFGCRDVIYSGPRFRVRARRSHTPREWIEVETSRRHNFVMSVGSPRVVIALPGHKTDEDVAASAISPSEVDGPSASTSRAFTRSLHVTRRWWMQVPPLDAELCKGYTVRSPVNWTTMVAAATRLTTAGALGDRTAPRGNRADLVLHPGGRGRLRTMSVRPAAEVCAQ
jgi:hypothetical protein